LLVASPFEWVKTKEALCYCVKVGFNLQNFLKNSLNMRNEKLAEEVWEIFSKAKQAGNERINFFYLVCVVSL